MLGSSFFISSRIRFSTPLVSLFNSMAVFGDKFILFHKTRFRIPVISWLSVVTNSG